MIRQPKASTTKNITKMSRIAVRDSTMCMPSSAMSRPTVAPSTVERNIRRATRVITMIEMTPQTAAIRRQPNASLVPRPSPILMPSAMIHLPSGGWTTKSPYSWVTTPAPSVSWRHSTL
jgi:hypothetical protein